MFPIGPFLNPFATCGVKPWVNRNPGIAELLQNARWLLAFTVLGLVVGGHLATGTPYALSVPWTLKVAVAVAAAGLYAGGTVLLKGPYGCEREGGLDSEAQRGLSLFYGIQIGCFVTAYALLALTLLF